MLDGQAVTDADRAAAAAFGSMQATAATAASAEGKQDSPAASPKSRPKAAALPSSPQTGLHIVRAKSVASRQKKSGAVAALSGANSPDDPAPVGKPPRCVSRHEVYQSPYHVLM